MTYKMTRKDNALVEPYGKLDVVSTIDNETGEYYIDVIYHGTDVGLYYIKTDKENYTKDLSVMEAFCLGYSQAEKDMEGAK